MLTPSNERNSKFKVDRIELTDRIDDIYEMIYSQALKLVLNQYLPKYRCVYSLPALVIIGITTV